MQALAQWLRQPSPSRLALELAVVFALALAWLQHIQFVTLGIAGADGYYHIKMAWMLRTQGIVDEFPWAAASLWRDHYFDKDFGFHLLLIPFTFGDLVRGAKWAAVFYGSVFFVNLYAVLSLRRVQWPWFWTLLLAAAGGYIGFRMQLARPHLLSMTLSLWAVYFVLRGWWRGVGVLTAVYALCYTAPHVVVVYALIHTASGWLTHSSLQVRTVVMATLGILAGWLLHPHFPNNFIVWWVQNVDVLWLSWAGTVDLGLAGELNPADMRSFFLQNIVLLGLAAACVVYLARRHTKLPREVLSLVLISTGFFVMTCLSKRFVEYLVPFSIWTSAEILGPGLREWLEERRAALARRERDVRRAIAVWGVVLLTAFLLVRTSREVRETLRPFQPLVTLHASMWLASNTPDSALVFTCDWDDAPELFFFNQRNRYLIFLDPTYMYVWHPELWVTWRRVSAGETQAPVQILEQVFGARYGYCTAEFAGLRRQLESNPRVRVHGPPGLPFLWQIYDEPQPDRIDQISEAAQRHRELADRAVEAMNDARGPQPEDEP